MWPKISINIVVYNAEKWIKPCLDSVFSQTFSDFKVNIIDNASKDNTVLIIEKNYPQVNLIKSDENLGFTGGHNLALERVKGEYILVLNQDVILEPDFLEKAVNFLEQNLKCGVLTGKIKQLNVETLEKTNKIDSAGIMAFKSHRFIERGVNEEDRGQYSEIEEVFGVTGAAPIYRWEALEDVKYKDEYFDKNFFIYKEDLDLSYRLRWRGWQIWYLASLICYHARTAAIKTGLTQFHTLYDHKLKKGKVNYWSYRNHIYLLIKNLSRELWQKFWLYILFYELRKVIYCIFAEPKTLKAWSEIKKHLGEYKEKHKYIMSGRKVGDEEMLRWFK